MTGGWGDEFDDKKTVSEEDKKDENTEQPQKEEKQEIMPFDNVEQLRSKEAYTVGVWKDEVIETVTKEMQESPVYLPPEEELSLDLASLALRIKNNFLIASLNKELFIFSDR